MTIQYIPLGIPVSTSLAQKVEFAKVVKNVPPTASLVEYTLAPAGPTGSHYKVASGSNVVISNI